MPFDEPKNYVAALVGLVLTALGLIPLLNKFGVIGWGIPESVEAMVPTFAMYIISIAGVYLLIDSFMEDHGLRIVSMVLALVFVAIGLIPILNMFGVIPFTIPVLKATWYYVIFVVEGIFLIIAAFTML